MMTSLSNTLTSKKSDQGGIESDHAERQAEDAIMKKSDQGGIESVKCS
ncbi:MAG: hypothetical protein OD814_000069 [Candidatus Alkanophagales archaeon MCA70_species_1]|nr:hypothetical protein [Candidatus Alkanophaga volatiphilum]